MNLDGFNTSNLYQNYTYLIDKRIQLIQTEDQIRHLIFPQKFQGVEATLQALNDLPDDEKWGIVLNPDKEGVSVDNALNFPIFDIPADGEVVPYEDRNSMLWCKDIPNVSITTNQIDITPFSDNGNVYPLFYVSNTNDPYIYPFLGVKYFSMSVDSVGTIDFSFWSSYWQFFLPNAKITANATNGNRALFFCQGRYQPVNVVHGGEVKYTKNLLIFNQPTPIYLSPDSSLEDKTTEANAEFDSSYMEPVVDSIPFTRVATIFQDDPAQGDGTSEVYSSDCTLTYYPFNPSNLVTVSGIPTNVIKMGIKHNSAYFTGTFGNATFEHGHLVSIGPP